MKPFIPIPLFASLRSEFGINGRLKWLKESTKRNTRFYYLIQNLNALFKPKKDKFREKGAFTFSRLFKERGVSFSFIF